MRIATLAAAAALAVSTPALAQQTGQGTPGSGVGNGTIDTSYGNPQGEDDDGFPWGLLGLLGLAGLLPRKRHSINVDNRTPRN
ncbi:MAG TPA: WGxxGxxG family protein [Allosphingosinicella sp.]|jgi:MYXO-CTERM domain-containing protein